MKRVPLYSLVLLSSVVVLLLSACGADQSEATPLTTVATSSHTGALPAVHMELKRLNSNGEAVGRPVCEVYGTLANTRPTTTCPHGEYKEQLFNEDWSLVEDGERDVTVGPTTDPEPGTPPSSGDEAPLTNPNRAFYEYEDGTPFVNTPSNGLNFNDLSVRDDDYDDIETEDDGDDFRDGAGNFRVSCQYSHFAKDDPILKPDRPGESHLHMFFGKTNTNAGTDKDTIASTGGGTCNGFALNRSAYWTPALLDGDERAIVPKQIIVYYKSARVNDFDVDYMPQGLELLGGNIPGSDGWLNKNPKDVFWSCGPNGYPRKDETISADLEELADKCGPDELINATIYFPQCVARENPDIEENEGNVKLSSDDPSGFTHTYRLSIEDDERGHAGVSGRCPRDFPVRIPELAILLYYPSLNELNRTSFEGLKLSSDMGATPGSTLHADWMGGWHTETMKKWVDNCNRAKKNCTIGEPGTETGIERGLKRAFNRESEVLNHSEICEPNEDKESDCNNDDWLGPYVVPLPERLQ